MISNDDIQRTADLARIKITDEEKEGLKKDLSSTLDFVSQLKEVEARVSDENLEESNLSNVFRDDDAKNEELLGLSEKLVDMAPERKGDYVRVKRIM